MTCKCGSPQALAGTAAFAESGAMCHKCGHPLVDPATQGERTVVMQEVEAKRQVNARRYRSRPRNLSLANGYLPPLGGDARAR
jgi:hypothetical protein